jgi:hypothetical protein
MSVRAIEEVKANGRLRRRRQATMERLYFEDTRRWARILALGGGLLAFATCGLTAITINSLAGAIPFWYRLIYAVTGALSAWLISMHDLRSFGGLVCYGGSLVAVAVVGMVLGIQPPSMLMAFGWLVFLLCGGLIGLLVSLREWRVTRALALADEELVEDPGTTTQEVPTPELDPELHRPGFVLPSRPPPEAIPFSLPKDADQGPEPQEATPTREPPRILDEEGFRPPG